MRRFEKITEYQWDTSLPMPSRKTEFSAGYDMVAAEDMIIPSYWNLMERLRANDPHMPLTLDNMGSLTKAIKAKPTLVPTGMKCYLNENEYLELSVRSSSPLKYWLILANGEGIIDRDYADNPDNEGHIFFQLINLSPFDLMIKKGEAIGQGIIKTYLTTDDDNASGVREGGFGSTTR